MKKDKFLTVYAVLDDNCQNYLSKIQSNVINSVGSGTQTMGIPFHITLGSFPPSEINTVIEKMQMVSLQFDAFSIDFGSINNFNNRVLFISPDINNELVALHQCFDSNYADGYEWHPHCTVFCGENSEVLSATLVVEKDFRPFTAKAVAIEVGEFFPTKIIKRFYLKNEAER